MQTHVERILAATLSPRKSLFGICILLSRPIRASVTKKIGQMSSSDQTIRVYAEVVGTNPFVIGDGSGTALVKSPCEFKEGQKLRVIGHVSVENGRIPEIDPIIIQDMSNFDFALYDEKELIKKRLSIHGGHGK
jgi:hypothetical protein